MTRGLGGSLLPYRVRDFHSLFLASFPGAQPDPFLVNFGAFDTVPEPYQYRNLYKWNNGTLLRTNVAENRRIGHMLATATNAATGPVSIVIPLSGVSMLDSIGGDFWDPEADQACFEAIKETLKPGIPLIELDNNINDPEFADKAAEILLDLLRRSARL